MKTLGKYVLDEQGEPVPEYDLLRWAAWFEDNRNQRIVKQETIGTFWVSTVFLAVDHSFGGKSPVLWETMVFLQKDIDAGERMPEQDMERCGGSREQAEAMHQRMVHRVMGELGQKK